MNPERWNRIHELFERALERPEAARRAFVASACDGDDVLRDEVVSLLEAAPADTLPATWLGALAAPEPPRFTAGERIADRYVVGALLGRGGMGEVYEAADEELGITVALKTLLGGDRDDALARLRLEGLLAREIWHPHVCRVYDLGRHAGDVPVAFLTMERLEGETLAERLRRDGPLPPERARALAAQMAAALSAAHQAGVVHRDFKPGNVMLVRRDGTEQAVVTDFGTARLAAGAGAAAGASGVIVGTPAYMPPEQLRGEEAGPAADIHALGAVLFEMMTGEPPFVGDTTIDVARRRLTEDAPRASTRAPGLDPRWDAAIARCLERDPARRFARADDVVAALSGDAAAGGDDGAPRLRALPAERDRFVGRAEALERLAALLAGPAPILALVGAGGMGKTRLAIRCGWLTRARWPGAVWFCDLTHARDFDGIVSAVAGTLGVELARGDAAEQLGHAIAGRGRCLVILDGYDHVVGLAPATLGRWAARAPDARFVITSRERPGPELGAVIEEVGPLSLECGLELFEARARWLRPSFHLDGDDADAAREIVALVDGMPLAIELAAARIRVMRAGQIAERMRKRFRLLTGGRSARHETLEGVIDGSFELLTGWERAAWAQCAVFEGGFTLDAAAAVVDLGSGRGAPPVLDVISSLLDRSLLRVRASEPGVPAGPRRFGMDPSLREYAAMKLREPGAIEDGASGPEAVRGAEVRHGRWYASDGTPDRLQQLDRHGGVALRHALWRELDNLIAACERALARGDEATALDAYAAATHVLFVRGPLVRAVALGHAVLARITARPLRARTQLLLGWVELFAGRPADAAPRLAEAIETLRALGDRTHEAVACSTLAILEMNQGRMPEAHALFERELDIVRACADRVREGIALLNVGECLRREGRVDEARTCFETALVLCREAGNRRVEGMLHTNLGQLHRRQGRLAEAREHLEAALAIAREVGSRIAEANALNTLGNVHFERREFPAAGAHFRAALALNREAGSRFAEGLTIGNLGYLHVEEGRLTDARDLYVEALAIFREVRSAFGEAEALGALAALHLREGRLDAAGDAVREGEAVARAAGGRFELAALLCVRAELEHRQARAEAARSTLGEIEAIAAHVGAGPDSDLGRRLTALRTRLA